MSRVTVVIPTRNRPMIVCQAVRSVLGQTFTDLEVVVVIDGIDKATEAALATISDSRLRVIPLQESVGGCEARNTGVRAAASPWIALLDDDDEWLPTKLEVQLEFARDDSEQMVIYATKYYLRNPYSNKIWPMRAPRPNEPISEYLFCTSRNLFQTSTLLVPTKLLLLVPFKKGLKRLQDWDWLLRACSLPEVSVTLVEGALSIYNVQGDGTISKAVDWEGSLRWAKENRELFTARSYSSFIAKKCAPEAAQQKAGLKALSLFKECLVGGGFTVRGPVRFVVYYFLSVNQRRWIGDRLMLLWATAPRRAQSRPAES